MKDVEKLYDAAASRYDIMYDSETNKNIVQAENRFLKEMLPIKEYKTVLDCGAGTGLWLDLFSDTSKDGYVGFDISSLMIHQAKKKHPKYTLFKDDFMKYEDEKLYDLVVSFFSITDYCGSEGFYKLTKHAKKGGLVYATFMNVNGGYDAVCHKEMESNVKTHKYSYQRIQELIEQVDYNWSYILGFSSLQYNDNSYSEEEIFIKMKTHMHKLNDCKYYLLMMEI